MIGDEHVDAGGARRGDPSVAGNAIVDRHDQRRAAHSGQGDDLRRQAVAELEAVRDQKIHRRKTPAAQRAHEQRGTGSPIGVEVADDEHQPAALAVLVEQLRGRPDRIQGADGQQPLHRQRQLGVAAHAAGDVHPLQHRMHRGIEHTAFTGQFASNDPERQLSCSHHGAKVLRQKRARSSRRRR